MHPHEIMSLLKNTELLIKPYDSPASHLKPLIFCCALLTTAMTHADDTEIYTGKTDSVGDPNVIFVFDTSGSMDSSAIGRDGESTTRIGASIQAATDIMSGLSNVNIGVMRFSPRSIAGQYIFRDRDDYNFFYNGYYYGNIWGDYGGYIISPVSSINDEDHRKQVLSSVNALEAEGTTPLLESYDEAARYLRGDPVKYGKYYGNAQCTYESKTVTVPDNTPVIQVCGAVKSSAAYKYNCEETGSLMTQYGTTKQGCRVWTQDPRKKDCSWTGSYQGETVPGYSYTEPDALTCTSTSTAQYFYVDHPDSYDAATGNYISPIKDSCQANHIILFTDGASNDDWESDSRVHSLLKGSDIDQADLASHTDLSKTCVTKNESSSSPDSCLEEMAYSLYESDNIADSKLQSDDNAAVESKQMIFTHTVSGFSPKDFVEKRLEDTAKYGHGTAASATDYASLVKSLNEIFLKIASTAGSFTAPSIAVNALNRLENSDELYYALFKPSISKGWSGNLKRYELGSDSQIYDAAGKLAVDPNTGSFSSTSTSFWTLSTAAPDGDDVTAGGAASRLGTARNVITHLATSTGYISTPLLNSSSTGYSIPSGITQTLFNTSMSNTEFLGMLQWADGITVNTNGVVTARNSMEDPLHSRPVVLHYGVMDDGKTLDSTVFVGTNSGYLHAIDSNVSSPKERFAYIPKELLPNITEYYSNGSSIGKVYGIDGPISSYMPTDNGTKYIIDNGDQALLYIGLRRGGSHYYALDVTDRDKPIYLWQIDGGSGDFTELGQSWSKMTPVNMLPSSLGLSGTDSIKVLIFGGGYDTAEDDNSGGSRITHTKGNAIFIVNALTGKLIWKASATAGSNLRLSTMTSSIASDLTPVDNDGDGNIDIIYATDIGGRIWRVNFFTDGTQKAKVIADLNDGSAAGNVRFYTKPDVSYMKDSTGLGRYVIAAGSGYRAHPLSEAEKDNLYVIFDYIISENESEIKTSLDSYVTLTKDDLANVDNYSSATADQKVNGYYKALSGVGEKSLSNGITVDQKIYFSSYSPDTSSNYNSCSGNLGSSKLYALSVPLNVSDGAKIVCKGSICIKEPDEPVIDVFSIPNSDIPPDPVVVYRPDESSACASTKTLLIGSTAVSLDSCISAQKNYWREL